jgi:hypothetical protein
MKNLFLICLLLIVFPVCFSAQDSDQKEEILNARQKEKEKQKNRKDCKKLGSESIRDNRCYESYPTDIMDWGKGFSNGLAKITVNGKAGFINTKGQVVVKTKLKDAGHFSENLAPFESNKGKWGYINNKGEVVIKPQFDWAITFHEGLALVQVGELWGYIDQSGKFIVEPKFEQASSFEEGFAVVGYYDKNYASTTNQKSIGKWQLNFIDKTGKVKFSMPFDGISRNFNGGLAIVSRSLGYSEKYKSIESETYIINTNGNELWKLNSWYVSWFSDDVIIVAVGEDEKGKDIYSFVDRNGNRKTDKNFSDISEFSEGLSGARVSWEGKYGYIDKNGNFVIEPKFNSASSFSEGLAGAGERYDRYGYIDKSGNWAIKPQFGWVWEFQEGVALVAPNGDRDSKEKTGYIDRSGNYIWKPTK